LVNAETDEQPGGREWLKYYAAALAEVFKKLNDDELQQCEELAEKWNQDSLPAEKQERSNIPCTMALIVSYFSNIQ
jgi:hypothetical protein